MPEVRAEETLWPVAIAVDSALAVGLVLAALVAAGPSVGGRPPALEASAHPPPQAAAPALTVDPPSFWMRTGENVSLQALWSSDSPLCPVMPLWYRWAVVDNGATGFLNATTTASATFTADSFDSGGVSVTVRSGATVDCGGNQTVVVRSVSAVVTIVVPLAVTGVHLTDCLLVPEGNTTLEGNVSGGSPPYSLDLFWGDGSVTNFSLGSPGPFEANHTFGAGMFIPYVVAVDSGGDLVNRSVAEAVEVGSGLEVTVLPASYVAEVGDPTDFFGVVKDPLPGAVSLYDCANAVVGPSISPSPVPNATGFSCTFDTPGVQEVLFGSYPPEPGNESASAVLYEVVVSPPKISVSPVELAGEVGRFVSLRILLTGGALPVTIHWNLTGSQSSGSSTVDTDGGGVVTVALETTGECPLVIQAADKLGGSSTSDTIVLDVAPPLGGRASGAGSITSSGALAQVSGNILSGLPPFTWWVVPGIAPTTGTGGNGTLATVGGFSWDSPYLREGNLTVSVGVADSSGSVWQTDLVIGLLPPLSAQFSATAGPPSSNGSLEVGVVVHGGWPPFQLFVNASNYGSWNRTVSADGPYRYSFPTDWNGTLLVTVCLTDSLGGLAEGQSSIPQPQVNEIKRPRPPARPSREPSGPTIIPTQDVLGLAASFTVVIGITCAVAVLLRRFRRREDAPTASPTGRRTGLR